MEQSPHSIHRSREFIQEVSDRFSNLKILVSKVGLQLPTDMEYTLSLLSKQPSYFQQLSQEGQRPSIPEPPDMLKAESQTQLYQLKETPNFTQESLGQNAFSTKISKKNSLVIQENRQDYSQGTLLRSLEQQEHIHPNIVKELNQEMQIMQQRIKASEHALLLKSRETEELRVILEQIQEKVNSKTDLSTQIACCSSCFIF